MASIHLGWAWFFGGPVLSLVIVVALVILVVAIVKWML